MSPQCAQYAVHRSVRADLLLSFLADFIFLVTPSFTDLSMLAKIKCPKSKEKMDFGGR